MGPHAGGSRQRAGQRQRGAGDHEVDDMALPGIQRVAQRRAHGLVDRAAHAGVARNATWLRYAWWTSPESVTMLAGGVPRSPAPTDRWISARRSNDSLKAPSAPGPAPGAPAPRRVRRRAPGAAADGLVPRLQMVHGGGQQPWQRGGDQQVVEAPAGMLLDPLPLLVVEHRPVALVEHAPRARVDHHQARVAEVAVVAPAAGAALAVGSACELAQHRRRRPARSRVPAARPGPARPGSGCRRAGRSSTTSGPPRCARPTSRSRASPPARPPRCSSRRARRGRRRSSRSRRWRAASGSPGSPHDSR